MACAACAAAAAVLVPCRAAPADLELQLSVGWEPLHRVVAVIGGWSVGVTLDGGLRW